jgi:hypothetical protein
MQALLIDKDIADGFELGTMTALGRLTKDPCHERVMVIPDAN